MRFFSKLILSIIFFLTVIWLIFWLFGRKTFPVEYGVSFDPEYAVSLGLDWRDAFEQILTELKPSSVRISAPWSRIEKTEGDFSFSDIDWMMHGAAQTGTRVVLVVGQKAPRWPECYLPEWIEAYEPEERDRRLLVYLEAVVERYRTHPALEIWQVENEPFIRFEFGNCPAYNKGIVKEEVDRLRVLDPSHKILVTDSGELSTWRRASRLGDIFGTTLYRIVQNPRGWTLRYDWLPAGHYFLKSRLWGRGYDDFFVAELQAEPWFTQGSPISVSVEEQEKTMDPDRLERHIAYASRVGASRVYLWGAEWWYFMKTARQDDRYWEMVKRVM